MLLSMRTTIAFRWAAWIVVIFICVDLLRSLLSLIQHWEIVQLVYSGTSTSEVPYNPNEQKPENLTVRVLVFYGRRDRAELLHCYLERNLIDNGGWIDQVIWVVNTTVSSDVTYLNQLTSSQPRYSRQLVSPDGLGTGFRNAYSNLEPGCLYIKVDDDVVWINTDTIPRLVHAKLNHPEHLIVSANVINSPLMGEIHHDRGAHHAYLPALFQPISDITTGLWDYTRYPHWHGPASYRLSSDDHVDPRIVWLPAFDIDSTPLNDIEYHPWGNALYDFKLAYQASLSLLQNLRDDQLSRYWSTGSGPADPFHFTDGLRLSSNLIAMWSDDILDQLPMDEDLDDEAWLTIILPKRLRKHVVVENRALAAHFSFNQQRQFLEQTDLLARYRDYARYAGCIGVEEQ